MTKIITNTIAINFVLETETTLRIILIIGPTDSHSTIVKYTAQSDQHSSHKYKHYAHRGVVYGIKMESSRQ